MNNCYNFIFSNHAERLSPYYMCGYNPDVFTPMIPWGAVTMRTYSCKYGYPLPVVPVPYIFDLIKEAFDVDFRVCKRIEFGRQTGYSLDSTFDKYIDSNYDEFISSYNMVLRDEINQGENSKIFDLGVIPCCRQQPSELLTKTNVLHATNLVLWKTIRENPLFGNKKTDYYGFSFSNVNHNLFWSTLLLSGYSARFALPRYNFQCCKVSGFVTAYFNQNEIDKTYEWKDGIIVNQSGISMTFLQDKGTGEPLELASVEGVYLGYETVNGKTRYVYSFDMRSNFGISAADIQNLAYGVEHPQLYSNSGLNNRNIFVVFDGANPTGIKSVDLTFEAYFNEGGRPHPMSPIHSLPDISVIDFVKSLYYLDGGVPKNNGDGTIGICHYIDLKKNYEQNNIYDWTKYIISQNEVVGRNINYGQHNYYVFETDDTESDKDVNAEGYEKGLLDIECPNQMLNETSEVVKFPFAWKFVSHPDYKTIKTGNTFKYWNIEKMTSYRPGTDLSAIVVSAEEAMPFIGYLSVFENRDSGWWFGLDSNGNEYNDRYDATGLRLAMNPLDKIENNENYKFLKNIIGQNSTIKIKATIPLIELQNIDYAKPVFIEKYNSYFAIVNIEWHSDNGISDVELIKIPF